VILFLHWLGWAIWLGAQVTFMVWGPVAKRLPLEAWAYTWDTLSKIQRWIVAPACAVATITGIILSMQYAQRDTPDGATLGATWLVVMQSLGLLAGIMTLALATPLVNRIAFLAAKSLEAGKQDPRAEAVRKKLALAASVSGAFILVSLYFSAVKP
jgi:hypothetical protein